MALLEQFNSPGLFPVGAGFEQITQPSEMAWPGDKLDNKTALKIVTQDKARAVNWQTSQGLPLDWDRQDKLYLFQVPKRTWDGTNVPRSSLAMPLVYEHVESLLPQLMSSLFADEPPFLTEPRGMTSMDAARANTQILTWQLEQINAREEVRLGLKHMLIHGMGIWKGGWQSYERKRTVYHREATAKHVAVGNLGGPVAMRPKGYSKKVPKTIIEHVNLPTFEHRDARHILVDPGLRSSNIRKAGYVIDVNYLTVLELDKLRDYEGYSIPPRDELLKLMFEPGEIAPFNPLETMQISNEFRRPMRAENTSADKLQHKLRVDEYWTGDRVMTVVQDKLVIRNEANPDGEIPFFSVAMADVLGTFKGISVADLVGNEQRMQQGVINTFLDDLALSLNGMFVRKRGKDIRSQSLRMRPGGVIEVDEISDIDTLKRNPIETGSIQQVLAASDSRAAKRTAASETSVQGVMPSGQSSITRTAAGVNSLSSGTGTRLQESLVMQFGKQVWEPFLQMVHTNNGRFLEPDEVEKLLTQELATAYEGDVIDILNGTYSFELLAASRLQVRASMKQSLPLLYQFLLQEPVLNGLADQNMKVNIAEMVSMTFDATGYPNKHDVIVPMSPQDIQNRQANSPAAQQQAKMQAATQMEQVKTNNKSAILDQENEARAARDVIRGAISRDDHAATGD